MHLSRGTCCRCAMKTPVVDPIELALREDIGERDLTSEFFVRVPIPAELVDGDESVITIETDQVFVPGERTRRSQDRRHLGLRVFACELSAAS